MKIGLVCRKFIKEGDINKLLGQRSNKFIEGGGNTVRRQPEAKIGENHRA